MECASPSACALDRDNATSAALSSQFTLALLNGYACACTASDKIDTKLACSFVVTNPYCPYAVAPPLGRAQGSETNLRASWRVGWGVHTVRRCTRGLGRHGRDAGKAVGNGSLATVVARAQTPLRRHAVPRCPGTRGRTRETAHEPRPQCRGPQRVARTVAVFAGSISLTVALADGDAVKIAAWWASPVLPVDSL